MREEFGRNFKDGLVAENRSKKGIRDHGGNDAENDSFGFEILAVEHFNGHHRSPQRRPKNGSQTGGTACQQHQPAFAGVQFEQAPDS